MKGGTFFKNSLAAYAEQTPDRVDWGRRSVIPRAVRRGYQPST